MNTEFLCVIDSCCLLWHIKTIVYEVLEMECVQNKNDKTQKEQDNREIIYLVSIILGHKMKFVKTNVQFLLLTKIKIGTPIFIILSTEHFSTLLLLCVCV